jgi:hypothetical protein
MFMNAAELHETWIDLPRGAPITVGNFGDQILLEPSYRLLNGQLVDLGRADARIDRPGHQDHAAELRRIAVLLLMFVTAQTHFSALAQPAPGGQHPALLASYVKRPP